MRLAVPLVGRVGHRDPHPGDQSGNLVADIDAVGDLSAEDTDMRRLRVGVDLVLAREQHPVALLAPFARPLDDQRTDPTTLGNDVGRGQGLVDIEPLVDIVENKLPVFLGDFTVR